MKRLINILKCGVVIGTMMVGCGGSEQWVKPEVQPPTVPAECPAFMPGIYRNAWSSVNCECTDNSASEAEMSIRNLPNLSRIEVFEDRMAFPSPAELCANKEDCIASIKVLDTSTCSQTIAYTTDFYQGTLRVLTSVGVKIIYNADGSITQLMSIEAGAGYDYCTCEATLNQTKI